MSVGSADFWTAIESLWNSSGLNAQFKAAWSSDTLRTNNVVLHDEQAAPHQPFPYCTLEVIKPRVLGRMTGGPGAKRQLTEAVVMFNIHAMKSATQSAKQLAAFYMGEVMKVFGGHPTVPAMDLTLEHGGHLLTQLLGDWPQRTEQYNYKWVLNYRFLLDVPVAT
jgi:hypothetical protein